ncbi:MAG: dynamin family protein [Bacillota bacterium]|nr:dynamin family protein [Bacillota bacterium]
MEEFTLKGFSDYRQRTAELRDDLNALKEMSAAYQLDDLSASIGDILDRSIGDSFDIAVIGEFKRGKSTLINALLGEDILPSDAMPATAVINRITYDLRPYAEIEFKDGRVEEIGIEEIPDYVTKLTEESEQMAQTVRQAIVHYPVSYCKNNVDIIDTPGLNDDATMAEVTLSVVPQIDAALFVIMAQSPFSEYERDFLENKLLTSDMGRVLFVVTGIDRLSPEDADRVLENIRERIDRYVIDRAKAVMGEDSPEFERYRRKIGTAKVYGLSAKQALKAKLKNDGELLAKSRFPAFEAELERFLSEDRGAIALQIQANKALSSAAEILRNIEMRKGALAMSAQEFAAREEEARQQIATLREERDQEFERLSLASQKAYLDVLPEINAFWSTLEEGALNIVEEEVLGEEDLKQENAARTAERILKKAGKHMDDQARLLGERMQNTLGGILGKGYCSQG